MTATDLEELAAHMSDRLGEAVERVSVSVGALALVVRPGSIVEVLRFSRNDPQCQFTSLIDICGVDYPEREKRFDVVYHLLSMSMNQRLRVRVEVGQSDQIPSAVEVHPSANWYEREAFDMYGVVFTGHPDLRRILTDYGFEGHPLRKDFPLSGHHQVRYDLGKQKVVREPVVLAQAYRDFDFASPWRGQDRALDDG